MVAPFALFGGHFAPNVANDLRHQSQILSQVGDPAGDGTRQGMTRARSQPSVMAVEMRRHLVKFSPTNAAKPRAADNRREGRFSRSANVGYIDRNAVEASNFSGMRPNIARRTAIQSQMEMHDAPEQFGVYGCISGYRQLERTSSRRCSCADVTSRHSESAASGSEALRLEG
jgi:hypothetical protein